jgi:hypothetical protein
MQPLCGACQRPIILGRARLGLCCECAEKYQVLLADGRLKPRTAWPAWLRYATSNEQARRRQEVEAERWCAPLDVSEGG